jgi:hypothetical protein
MQEVITRLHTACQSQPVTARQYFFEPMKWWAVAKSYYAFQINALRQSERFLAPLIRKANFRRRPHPLLGTGTFDRIKIDRSFVADLEKGDLDSLAIVRAVAGLSSSLNIATTAEGVETERQLARLREEGCDTVQGFLLAAAGRGGRQAVRRRGRGFGRVRAGSPASQPPIAGRKTWR